MYGVRTPDISAAMIARLYFEKYGATRTDLAAIAMASRKYGSLNPNAIIQDRISLEDYLAAPMMAAPLCLFDYPQVAEGSACVLVTSADRARDLRKPPVYISGVQPIPAGRKEAAWTYPGFGVGQQRSGAYNASPQPVYKMAGVDQSAIDALFIYDAFSIQVWMALERWGFCKPGEAAAFTQGSRIELHGDLPINTNGGYLSEGHLMGWNTHVELVRQLRGECGERQLSNVEVVQWATTRGDSLIYRR